MGRDLRKSAGLDDSSERKKDERVSDLD